jgi:hypothetical protein
MNILRILSAASLVLGLAACATGASVPTGPGQLVNITLQPVRVPPNPQGAMALSVATGCTIEFVGRGPVEPVFQFQVRPSERVPKFEQCLESLKVQPGVEGVAVVK